MILFYQYFSCLIISQNLNIYACWTDFMLIMSSGIAVISLPSWWYAIVSIS